MFEATVRADAKTQNIALAMPEGARPTEQAKRSTPKKR
jgi:hypothetical protein